MTVVDPTQRDDVIAQIRKVYDDHTVMKASSMPNVRRLPFEQPALDYISGGGVPWGRMSRFWGGWGSCKSTSIWNLIANAQNYGAIMNRRLEHEAEIARMSGDKQLADQLHQWAVELGERYADGLECAYLNIENQIDPVYARHCGVDIDRLEVVNSTRVEDIGTQAELLMRSFHFLAFDSCTNAITVEEMKHQDGLYHHPVGVRAFKWGQVLSWMNDRLNEDNIIIYVDQIRSQVGMGAQQRLEMEKAPGGRMMEHNSSLTLHFVKGAWLFRKPDGSLAPRDKNAPAAQGAFDKTEPEGNEVWVKCDKSRVGRGDRTALLHYDKIAQNFDVLHEYEKLGKYFQVVKRTSAQSSWYELPDGRKVQKLRQHVSEDPTLKAAIEDVALRCAQDPAYEAELLRGLK